MNGSLALDANLVLLLIVGSCNRQWISRHKKLADKTCFSEDSYDRLLGLIANFSELVFLPNVLTEVNNQLDGGMLKPAPQALSDKLAILIRESEEAYVRSDVASDRPEFNWLGLTDVALLLLCSTDSGRDTPTLVTLDIKLAAQAQKLGLSVINYREFLEFP